MRTLGGEERQTELRPKRPQLRGVPAEQTPQAKTPSAEESRVRNVTSVYVYPRASHVVDYVSQLDAIPGVQVVKTDAHGQQVWCHTTEAKVALGQSLATIGARVPVVASLALRFRRSYPRDLDCAAALLAFVQSTVRWVDEPGERFCLPQQTLLLRCGDCDDQAILLVALFLSAGLRAEFCALCDVVDNMLRESHATTRVNVNGQWLWADPSVSAHLDEDPKELRDKLARHGANPLGSRPQVRRGD